MIGGEGSQDTLYGGANGDLIYGDTPDDADPQSGDDDLLYGGEGVDSLFGGGGDDTLYGGGGGVSGAEVLVGGAGNDAIYNADEWVQFVAGEDWASRGDVAATNTAKTGEDLTVARAGNDFVSTVGSSSSQTEISGGSFAENGNATLVNSADVSGFGSDAKAGDDTITGLASPCGSPEMLWRKKMMRATLLPWRSIQPARRLEILLAAWLRPAMTASLWI